MSDSDSDSMWESYGKTGSSIPAAPTKVYKAIKLRTSNGLKHITPNQRVYKEDYSNWKSPVGKKCKTNQKLSADKKRCLSTKKRVYKKKSKSVAKRCSIGSRRNKSTTKKRVSKRRSTKRKSTKRSKRRSTKRRSTKRKSTKRSKRRS
jgi:hypothetical protein